MFHDLLTAQNRALVLRFYKAFDDRHLQTGLSLLSPALVTHMTGIAEPLTYDGFAALSTEIYNAFPDGRHHFSQTVARKDKVTTCGVFTGTHLDTFKGIPATGRQVSFSVMNIDRVSHSKIVEHWGLGDRLSMLQQLGIKVVPGPNVLMKMGLKASKTLTGDTFERLRAITQPDHYPQISES